MLHSKGEVEQAVETALRAGCKHIDAAAIYQNEKEVGEGIKKSGVNRDDIWITSKVSGRLSSLAVLCSERYKLIDSESTYTAVEQLAPPRLC